MRKFFIFILSGLLVPSAFALQQRKIPSLSKGTKGISLELESQLAVERAVREAFTHSSLITPFPIINLPTQPVVQFHVAASKSKILHTVQLVPHTKVFNKLFLGKGNSGFTDKKIFAPRGLIGPGKSLYRGIRLTDITELKNILVNGLDPNKGRFYKGEVYTSFDPVYALVYSAPRPDEKETFPVLIKIPFTQTLQKRISAQFPTATVFRCIVLPEMISDVWVLLEVNGKPDWCKAVLKDGELVLIPGYGKRHSQNELIQP